MTSSCPLAELLRPKRWQDFIGLDRLPAQLQKSLQEGRGRVPSLVLWGPPGSGKTTLARLVGNSFDCHFVEFSAVLSGVKDVRDVVERSKTLNKACLLFVDEIHRFNRSQQDAFLPHVESGLISLIGATTENPSFYLNSALLSRMRVLQIKAHTESDLFSLAKKAQEITKVNLTKDQQALLIESAAGDARQLLVIYEQLGDLVSDKSDPLTDAELREILSTQLSFNYDRAGDQHYQMVSAFIKSMRGSDPDAALYWGFRMIESGEDPRFIIRRMMIFASEDIGNADPRALTLAVSTAEAFDRLGLPEGKIPIAQCITYLASVPKSNRSYTAMHKVVELIKTRPSESVPKHLCNAPTALMKSLNYGQDYKYPHDYQAGYVPGERYLPNDLVNSVFYEPSDQGLERSIAERLQRLKS